MFWFCTSEIDSSPPPTATVWLSWITCFAAVAMAIRPEAHWRSRLMRAVVTGRPAASAAWRPMLVPVEPCCRAAPMTTSSISAGSTPARCTAWRMACPPSCCAWVSLNAPR